MQRQINEEELKVFYNLIGEAVWLIQYLEDVMVTFVVAKMHKRQPATAAEAFSRLEKERKGTLGTIYKKAKSEGAIPPAYETRFDKLLEERNWLIHRSKGESSSDLYNDAFRMRMIQRISRIQEESVQLRQVLFNEFRSFLLAEGCDTDLAFRMGDERIRKLKGE